MKLFFLSLGCGRSGDNLIISSLSFKKKQEPFMRCACQSFIQATLVVFFFCSEIIFLISSLKICKYC